MYGVLGGVVGAGIAPPVPAAVGVAKGDGDGLGIEDYEVILVGPAVVTGVLDEGGAVVKAAAGGRGEGEVALALLAAVQRDVDAALFALGAAVGHVSPAGGVEARAPAEGAGAAGRDVGALVELDEFAGGLAAGGREFAVGPAEDFTGAVVGAFADIGLLFEAAGDAVVLRRHGVPGVGQADRREVGGGHAQGGVIRR